MHLHLNCLYCSAYWLLSLILIFFSSSCATLNNKTEDKWFARDKAYHFAAGYIIGSGSALIGRNNGMDRPSTLATGIGTTIALGSGKEYYDRNIKKTYWSWKDITWNLFGALAGSFTVISLTD